MPVKKDDFILTVVIGAGEIADLAERLAADYPDGKVPIEAFTAALAEVVTAQRVNAAIEAAAAELWELGKTGGNVADHLRGGHF